MCSIMAAEGKEIPLSVIKTYFEKSRRRGPDMTRYEDVGAGYMCFHRLSIMGLDESGMQPFSLNGKKIVCNGEVYGFRKIKESLKAEYDFISDSDSEILLPLFEKYGCGMFNMLDAEFALVIFDGERFIAARDPIGIRPLFYGYTEKGNVMFASEAVSLNGLVKKVIPFPPGHYYADGKFHLYRDAAATDKIRCDDIDTICRNIREKLIDGVEKRLDSDAPMGFLLSGGLDSSLVCSISQKILGKKIRTFAIGMERDAIDLKYARDVAEFIGSEHTEVYMTEKEAIGSLEEVIASLASFDITTVRASVGMYLLCKAIHKNTDVRVLMTGEISDELFGYKYTDFAPNAAAFQKEAQKRIRELYMYDVLRADRCISDNSMEARVPFGDLEFVRYVMEIDPEKKLNTYGMGKYLLRRAFEGDFLPKHILYREKAAFSDAVGHSLVDRIKEYAENYYTDKEFNDLSAKYDYLKPFTKESLLYREIFEKHYPGQAEMIKDFWMPNKSWKGCDVNDPSARVLSNYGNSGV